MKWPRVKYESRSTIISAFLICLTFFEETLSRTTLHFAFFSVMTVTTVFNFINSNNNHNINLFMLFQIAGPEVNNCQPVVVTFEEFYDRDEVLKIAKLKR